MKSTVVDKYGKYLYSYSGYVYVYGKIYNLEKIFYCYATNTKAAIYELGMQIRHYLKKNGRKVAVFNHAPDMYYISNINYFKNMNINITDHKNNYEICLELDNLLGPLREIVASINRYSLKLIKQKTGEKTLTNDISKIYKVKIYSNNVFCPEKIIDLEMVRTTYDTEQERANTIIFIEHDNITLSKENIK